MSASLIHGTKGAGSTGASTTVCGLYGNGTVHTASAPTSANEAQVARVIRTAGVLSGLFISMLTNDRTGAGTIQSRKNGSNGNMSASITAATTGIFSDTTHSDSVSAGDTANYQVTTGSGGSTSAVNQGGAIFTPTSGSVTITFWGGFSTANMNGIGTVYYGAPSGFPQGNDSVNVAESIVQWTAKTAGNWRNLWCYISANSVSNAGTVVSRVGAANGAQSISLTGSTTGLFEDNTAGHTDSISSGNLLSIKTTTGTNSGTTTMVAYGSEFETANSKQQLMSCGVNILSFNNGGATSYSTPCGDTANSTTESDVRSKMWLSSAMSLLQVNVIANGLNQTVTFSSRKNSAAGAMAIAVTTGSTGYFTDNTGGHTDSISPSDFYAYSWTAAAGTGTFSFFGVGVISDLSAVAAPTRVFHRVIQ